MVREQWSQGKVAEVNNGHGIKKAAAGNSYRSFLSCHALRVNQ